MRSLNLTLLALLFVASSAGCGALRCIEQWKCDHLGLCHFADPPELPYAAPPPLAAPPNSCGPCGSQPPASMGVPAPMEYEPAMPAPLDPYQQP
jgi:hypothetical protein